MIFDALSDVYVGIEEKWYGLVDGLSDKGIPLYAYTDFLDKKGIPSLPFTVALMILLIALVALAFMNSSVGVEAQFRFLDDERNSLSNVSVEIKREDGTLVKSLTLSSGDKHVIMGSFNQKFEISASKSGFDPPNNQTLIIKGNPETLSFSFAKQREYVTGLLRFKSAESSTIITNVSCTASPSDQRIVSGENYEGEIHFSNMPEYEEVLVHCSANGYEDFENHVIFEKDIVRDEYMAPKTGELQGDEAVNVLFRVLDSETGELIPDFNITIINPNTDDLITTDDSDNGEYLTEILRGTVIKATAESPSYIAASVGPIEIVESATIEIEMQLGGTMVTVELKTAQDKALHGVEVMLLDVDGRLLLQKTSTPGTFSSYVVFEGLDPSKEYYITAWKNRFLPFRKKFSPAEEDYLNIGLEQTEQSNSGRVVFKILGSDGLPANNAKLRFYEYVDGKRVLVGIPEQKTDSMGTLALILPAGKFEVEVETEDERHVFELEVVAGQDNEEIVDLERKIELVELVFVDNEGNPIQGNVTIVSKSGDLLYEGRPSEDGSVVFDAKGEDTFDVGIETEDGRTFEEEVRLGGEKEKVVTLFTVEEKLIPNIEFLGVLDARGNTVEGISRGEYYWLKFVVSWSALDQAGVHIRVGDDSLEFADSMQYGIYGFDATSKRSFYGLSYQAPTGLRDDRQNRGRAGQKNKFLELLFDNPVDQYVVKVKVKALEDSREENMPVFYRAWVEASGNYYRDPEDMELGNGESTQSKSSLYAETHSANVKIFNGKPKCSNGTCLEFAFFDEEGTEFAPNNFKPVVGNTYALEVRASADSQKSVQLTAETSTETETLMLSDFSEGTTGWPQGGYENPVVVLTSLALETHEDRIARAYFEAVQEGAAHILVRSEGDEKIEKTLYFTVSGPREMEVEMTNNGEISPGDEFHVTVKDKETQDEIGDALISVFLGERPLFSLKGNSTELNGLEGHYLVDMGSLDPGIYRLTVARHNYIEQELVVVVTVDSIFGSDPEKEFFMKTGQEQRLETINVWNSIATSKIESVEYNFIPGSNWNNNFSMEVQRPSEVRAGGRATVSLNITFTGEPGSNVYAEGELVLTGILENGLIVETSTEIKGNYNKPVPNECLEITPTKNDIRIVAEENASESFDLFIKYLESDECNEPLVLNLLSELKGDEDEHLEITAPPLTITPGEETQLTVTVMNSLRRFMDSDLASENEKRYSLILDSDQVSSSVGLSVHFINPFLTLWTNDNIHIWISENEDTGTLSGYAPLLIRNSGSKPIEAITATEAAEPQSSGLFSVNIRPVDTSAGFGLPQTAPNAIVSLEPGDQLEPPWKIELIGRTTDYPEFVYPVFLDVSGTLDGKKYNPIRKITLWAHVSTNNCLKMSPIDDLQFLSEDSSQGVLSKKVLLKNKCGEILREISITPTVFGENELSLARTGNLNWLNPNEEAEFSLKLVKRSDYFNEDRPDRVNARGFLVSSQKFIESNPLEMIISLGEVPDTAKGPAFDDVEIPVCEQTDTVKSVAFPKISEAANCEDAYCDAVQFSEFISEKLVDLVDEANDKMRTAEHLAENDSINCPDSKPFCSFSGLGVSINDFTYTVYLRNDNVSADILEYALKDSSLSNFVVAFDDSEMSEIIDGATGFSAYRIYMNEEIKGCGRYTISLNGAVQNASGKLHEENLILLVKSETGRKLTPECTNRVQNIMNFLPADGDLKNSNRMDTWAGMIETANNLKDVGEDFAEALFGFGEGRVVTNANSTNKLNISLKELGDGRIMKLSIDQVSDTSAKPKTIKLELNALFNENDEQTRNDIAAKSKEALRALKNGSVQLDACIGSNEDYMLVDHFKKLGELAIEHDGKLPLYYDSKSCIKLKVSSTIDNEIIALKTNFSEMNATEKAGLSRVWLETTDSHPITEYTAQNPTQIRLQEVEDKEGLNQAFVMICAEGDNGFVHQAIGKKIGVMAKSISIGQEQDDDGEIVARDSGEWHEVEIGVCGMHPYDLLEKISGIKAETDEPIIAYTVLAWKGEPSELSLEAMIAAWKAFKIKQESGGEIGDVPTIESKLKTAKTMALIYSGLTCASVVALCNGLLLRTFHIILDVLLDCGVPTLIGAFGGNLSTNETWEATQDAFHVGAVDEYIDEKQELYAGGHYEDESIDEFEERIITGAMMGIGMRQFADFIGSTGPLATDAAMKFPSAHAAESAIKRISRTVADDAAQQMANGVLTNAAGRGELTKLISDQMYDKVSKELTSNAGKKSGLFRLKDLGIDNATSKAWGETTSSAAQRVLNKPGLLQGSDIARQADTIIGRNIDDVIDSARTGSGVTDDVIGAGTDMTIGTSGTYTSIDDAAEGIMKKVSNELGASQKLSTDRLRAFENDLRRKIKSNLGNSTNYSKDDLGRIVRSSVDDIKPGYGQDFVQGIEKNVDDELTELLRKSSGSLDDAAPKKGLKSIGRNFWKTITSGTFWKNLGINMMCGAVGNAAGIAVARWYMNKSVEEITASENEGNGFIFDGPLSGYEGVESFKKFKPYKVTIWKGDFGTTRVKIEEVEGDEQLQEMSEAITADRTKQWPENCDDESFLERDIDEAIGCLIPNSDSPDVSDAEVVLYYSHNALFAEVSMRTEPQLEEELLIAVLIMQPENLDTENNIDPEWYKKSEGERERSIREAAAALRYAIELEGGSGEVSIGGVIEEVAKKTLTGTELAAYRDRVLEKYGVWKGFNMCRQEPIEEQGSD